MPWLTLIVAFAVGALVAAATVKRFRRTKPGWSGIRRIFEAASLVPAAVVILALIGNFWAYATLPEGGESGREISVFIFTLVGLVLGVSALLGGLVGAGLAERRDRP